MSFLIYLPKALQSIRRQAKGWVPPVAGTFVGEKNATFKILISTVLSPRTKDSVTDRASRRLFALADHPKRMLRLSPSTIEKAIYPVGFYRTKAANVLKICRLLVQDYKAEVPSDISELLKFPGVGRKVANLVVTVGYQKPGICVDTHVHRISNRWGLVRTKTPDETEKQLRRVLPVKYWIGYNDLLVSYGQNLCVPVSPFCSRCRLARHCPKIGVTTRR